MNSLCDFVSLAEKAMEVSNLIACLYPYDYMTLRHAHRVIRNNPQYYIPPKKTRKRGRRSQDNEEQDPECVPGLQLTFNNIPKSPQEFVLGCSQKESDIVLPNHPTEQISRSHCRLTLDSQKRLILRDQSQYGTVVTYNDQGERRQNFTWLLSGREPDEVEKIVIIFHKYLKFRIIVSNQCEMCLDPTSDNLPAINKLSFKTAKQTQRDPSKALTPNQNSVFIKSERLGSGNYGVVYRVWDASTGIVYAAKEPKEEGLRFWEAEKDILERISHVSWKICLLSRIC